MRRCERRHRRREAGQSYRAPCEDPARCIGAGFGSSKDDAYVTKVAQANVSQAMNEIREKGPTIKAQLDAATVKVTFLPD
jgi:hypothetical protein